MTLIIGFIVIIIGLVTVISPYTAWYLQLGWKLKDAKPTDFALQMQRLSGIVFVIIGGIIIFSSFSSGTSSDRQSEKKYKEKLTYTQVQDITIGVYNGVTLSQEDRATVMKMIEEAELSPFDVGTSFGATASGSIIFTDQTSVELVIFGASGGIEIHPKDTIQKYRIMSEPLERWFEEYDLN